MYFRHGRGSVWAFCGDTSYQSRTFPRPQVGGVQKVVLKSSILQKNPKKSGLKEEYLYSNINTAYLMTHRYQSTEGLQFVLTNIKTTTKSYHMKCKIHCFLYMTCLL